MNVSVKDRFKSAGAKFKEASVRFMLPKGVYIDKGWHDVTTTAPTQVALWVTAEKLTIQIHPAFRIDITYPWEDAWWSGLTFNIRRGRFDSIDVTSKGWGFISVSGTVKKNICQTFSKFIVGTKFHSCGYDPTADRNLGQVLTQVMNRIKSGPSNSGVVAKNLTGLGASLTFSLNRGVKEVTAAGGIEIPSNGTIRLYASLMGTAEHLKKGTVKVASVHIDSEDIYVIKGNERLVKLQSIKINRGGSVEVRKHKALGSVKSAESTESVLRGLAALFAGVAQGGNIESGQVNLYLKQQQGGLNPEIVRGVTKNQLEKALTTALRKMYCQNYKTIRNAMPKGMSLDKIFGLQKCG